MDEFAPAETRTAAVRRLLPDPRLVWMIFRRNIWLFLAVSGAIVLGVAIWTLLQTPIYSASASVLIDPAGQDVVDVKAVTPDLPTTSDVVDTQVRLIQSPTIAERAAAAYAQQHPSDPRVAAADHEDLVDAMSNMVSVERVGLTYVINVNASSTDPQFAADTVNLFAQQYLDAQRQAKLSTNQQASSWLAGKVQKLRDEASAADSALQQYKISHGLMSANGQTMAEQEVSGLNQEIAAARADLAEKQGRLSAARKQLTSGGTGADVGAALESSTISGLRQSEATASAQVAELSSHYGPLYPDLVKAKSQLADIRSELQQEINRILTSLQGDVRVAQSRLDSLLASQSRATGSLASNNSAEVGLSDLQRRSDAANAIYQTFLTRLRETSAQQGLQQADARIASYAKVPEDPDFPNKKLAALFGILGGIAGGLMAIAAAEYLQGGIRTKSDVERKLRVRYAGAIPDLESTLGRVRVADQPIDYIVNHPFSTFAEAFRALQAFLLLGGSKGARAVAVTSALPQEGKTTTSVALARTAAMGGARTVLVDCDLRRRGASEMFIADGRPGLYEYMRREVTLDQALFVDSATGMAVLGTSEAPRDARDPLTPSNLVRLLAELRTRFEVIILDTAPVLGVADARAVAASADRVLVVAHWRKTSRAAVEAAIDTLLNAEAKISGVALSQVDIRRYASTGEADAYGYQKKFKGYYTN
ncbi:GumC family protein [Hephaestia mangrovi]|uniref:GumC family protein n=1 Tax=Hephaestia mangrovi TaxID=2873268 RepID=UPI001CA6BA49|nr:AAA family ATPase [Hephaestia mangrovi]MBY8829741.1 AAA family ATPase [Hephaestia mangrovi]